MEEGRGEKKSRQIGREGGRWVRGYGREVMGDAELGQLSEGRR